MANATDLVTELPFVPFKQRNAAIDSLFYDTKALTPEELGRLSPLIDHEGSIVVVPPAASGRPIRRYRTALRFMNREGGTVRAFVLAGVGSSVVGTAALARNVADAIGADAAGVVTGYGVSDLVTEALGGWFVFGAADRLRLQWEALVRRATTPLSEAAPTAEADASADAAPAPARPDAAGRLATGAPSLLPRPARPWELPGAADIDTLLDLLIAAPPGLDLLVGHSKGNLMIETVLRTFVDQLDGDPHPLFERLPIVTLGAVVGMPSEFPHVHQLIGELDWFGGMNSSLQLPHRMVPNAWHHLNRCLPYHLDVGAALRDIGVAPDS